MFHLSFDDTDSRKGMCTTSLTLELIRQVKEETGYLPCAYPLLVRLNPNIPWKTRGNGAVSVAFCLPGRDRKIRSGLLGRYHDGGEVRTVHGYEHEKTSAGEAAPSDQGQDPKFQSEEHAIMKSLSGALLDLLSRNSMLSDDNTNPGLAAFIHSPPQGYYHQALHGLVELEDFLEELELDREAGKIDREAVVLGLKKRRGIIGAVAASAWNWRESLSSFELLAYRKEPEFGTRRQIDKGAVKELGARFPTTFNSYDPENDYCAVIPNSPCPVLYGIRGTDPEELFRASDFLDGRSKEQPESKLVFRTNQGTDAHIRQAAISQVQPYGSFRVRGCVKSPVKEIRGGHLFFEVEDGEATLKCAAFEPTKGFRKIVRALEPGDELECWGGVHEPPFTLNIEKLELLELAETREKLENPVCDSCRRKMKSLGRDAGYRCLNCGARKGEEAASFIRKERSIGKGIHEVPLIARRHLAMPLSLRDIFKDQ